MHNASAVRALDITRLYHCAERRRWKRREKVWRWSKRMLTPTCGFLHQRNNGSHCHIDPKGWILHLAFSNYV